jgi:hypothetical protein
MSDQQKLVRVDIPTEGTLLGAFRAFRAFAEKLAASKGQTLDPRWYEDGPEDRPELYDFSDPPEPSEPPDDQT